jgi:predicted PurR-regulated permease PerM
MRRLRDLVSTKTMLTAGLLLLGLWMVSGVLPALVWAVVIAVAIDPLYLRAEQRWFGQRHRNILAAAITLLIALVLIVPIVLGVTRAAGEAAAIVRWIGEAQRNGIAVPDWVHQLPAIGESVERWWQDHLATPEGATQQLHHINATNWIDHSRLIGAGLLRRSIILGITLIALFFLLRDRDLIVAQCRAAADQLLGDDGEKILRQAIQSVRGTIDGLVLVGLGEGAVMTIPYVALGVPHPLLLGAVTAVAAIIPFGAAVVFAFAAVALLLQGAGIAAIAVIVIGLSVVGIADHFVRPALIGNATRLPFLWVLVGIIGGVESFGLIGLFVGPATMSVLFLLWRDFLDEAREAPSQAAI